jgi:hypothetical protein
MAAIADAEAQQAEQASADAADHPPEQKLAGPDHVDAGALDRTSAVLWSAVHGHRARQSLS